MNRYVLLLLFLAATAAANTPPEVTHLYAQQRPNSQLVDITYSVVDPDQDPLTISVYLHDGSGVMIMQCAALTGAVGAGILPGTNKHITWDAGVDFFGQYGSDYTLRVVADDGFSNTPPGFVAIPPGTFTMGSPTNEPGRNSNETQHQVTLTNGIYVQTTEVTNQQYMEMAQWAYDHGYVTATSSSLRDNLDGSIQFLMEMGSGNYEISFSNGVFSCINPSHPVKYVTWYGAAAYCDWLSLQQGLPRAYSHGTWQCNGGNPYTAAGYRLPTEAEWEYSCRAGSATAFANGPITYTACSPIDPNLNLMGWYCGNAEALSHPVAQKTANPWGLYDMHGNLWEWCNDWWLNYGGTVTDPVGAGSGSFRVFRGGYSHGTPLSCRSAYRAGPPPYYSSSSLGFRPVISW